MSEKEEYPAPVDQEAEQIHPELVDVSVISEIIKGAIEPFAKSQEIVAKETTEQTRIIAKSKTHMFWGLCVLAMSIIIVAGMALYLNKENVTEKIIIALVGILGGLGLSKQVNK